MSLKKILIGIFMVGILCCGIGAGVMFQEYSSFEYMGEKRIESNKVEEKTLTENLYTDKTKKLNTSVIACNNEDSKIKVKTSKNIPKDKVQIKVRYDADNVRDIHIDKSLYSGDEYIEDDECYDESSEGITGKNPTKQEFLSVR